MKLVSLSSTQKIAVISLLLVIALAVATLMRSTSPTTIAGEHPMVSQTSHSLPPVMVAATATTITVPPVVKLPAPSQPRKNVSSKKVDVWKLGNATSPQPQIPLNNVIREYEVVEVSQYPERTPQVGETVSLPMLHGQKILVDVKTTASNPNGDKSWSGHLQGYDGDYPVIMTYGAHAIFAMITTPEGSYTMESTDGVGWLYKNPSEFELADANTKDYLEIPDLH